MKTESTPVSHDRHRKAARYLGSIRNPFKRSYGVKYWDWLTTGTPGESPNYDDISFMAAQAVRIRLIDIAAGID